MYKRSYLVLSSIKNETASRNFSSEIEKYIAKHSRKFPYLDSNSEKRGTGNRCSFNGKVVTVFGASGCFGNTLIPSLARIGCQIILPYRGELKSVYSFKPLGDLGQIHFVPFYLKDEESISKSMQYSNVVINLIGKTNETVNFSLKDVHVDGAQLIAKVAKQNNIQHFIHFSALNANPAPVGHIIRSGSEFLRTKYYGEQAVRAEFPEAIIFRPSRMFGSIDWFFNLYMQKWIFLFRKLPLWNQGKNIYKQPVASKNVAQGVLNTIFDERFLGKTIDAAGPRRYEMHELITFFNRAVLRGSADGYEISELRSNLLYLARTWFWGSTFKYPKLSLEKIELDCISDELTEDNLTLEDLGIYPLSLLEDEYYETSKKFESMNRKDETGFVDPPFPKFVNCS